MTTRTTKSIKNIFWGLFSQVFSMIAIFITRIIFINTLGNEYLSINGLFSNILTLISFAELGIGNAITYSLYKPLAENDHNKISAVINVLKKIQIYISAIVLVSGLLLMPFLKYIVTDIPDLKENIFLVYFLFLLNSSVSYLYMHAKILLLADQKNYIVSIIQQIIFCITTLIQIVILLVTQDYILYLLVVIVSTMTNNIFLHRYLKKKYIFLNSNIEIACEDKLLLVNNVKSIFIYKLSSTILTGTDNIIISIVLGTSVIGICSNHILVSNYALFFLQTIFQNIASSIGNLNVSVSNKERKKFFYEAYLISHWLYGMVFTMLLLFLDSFVVICFGNQFALSFPVVFVLALNIYLIGINSIPSTFRSTLGLFKEAKLIPLFAAIINIVLSIILVQVWGLFGLFLATCISRLFTFNIFDAHLVFKIGFLEKNAILFYLTSIFKFSHIILIFICLRWIITIISVGGFIGLVLDGIISVVIFNIIMIFTFHRTESFLLIKKRIYNILLSFKRS